MVSTSLITKAASAMTDEEVVERVRSGDTALFEVIMRRYNQRIYRVTRSILGNDGEAEEVTQEAYVRSYMHLNQFDGRAKFSTWLTKIAVHEALARRNKRQRFVEIDAMSGSMEGGMSLESKLPSPEQDVLTQSLRVILEAAIDRLPETYRSVFMLRDVEQMDTLETAECLDISEGSVKTRLHRARALLRKEIYAQSGVATASAFHFDGARCDRIVAGVFEKIRSQQ